MRRTQRGRNPEIHTESRKKRTNFLETYHAKSQSKPRREHSCNPQLSTKVHAETVSERLANATVVLKKIMNAPDKGIPQDLLDGAHCIVVVPGVKKAAFVVGGKYGRGFMSCRDEHGHWSSPGAVRIEGGSLGWQIGASETDLILLVMNESGMQRLLQSKFTLGRVLMLLPAQSGEMQPLKLTPK